MDDRPPHVIELPMDPDSYRRAAALVTAYSYGDAESCDALLAEDAYGLACALTIMLYSALVRSSDVTGCPFSEELQALAVAAAYAAEEEGS